MWTITRAGLQAPAAQALPSECPHCHAHAQLTPVSVPDFASLQRDAPQRVGIVFRCNACGVPRFFRFTVRRQESERIVLAGNGQELERAPERYAFGYLPANVARLFREALACHASDCFNAFASMCRRSAQAVFEDLGEGGRLRMFDTLEDIIELCELDGDTAHLLRAVIFGGTGDRDASLPDVDASHAGVLLEAMKDLLYQTYVRREKLTRAMRMRRFFAAQSGRRLAVVSARDEAPDAIAGEGGPQADSA